MKKTYSKAEIRIKYFDYNVDVLIGSNELPILPIDQLFME